MAGSSVLSSQDFRVRTCCPAITKFTANCAQTASSHMTSVAVTFEAFMFSTSEGKR